MDDMFEKAGIDGFELIRLTSLKGLDPPMNGCGCMLYLDSS